MSLEIVVGVHGVRWTVWATMVGVIGATACTKTPSEEDRVRAVIRKAIDAANEKRAGKVVEDTARDFKGPRGLGVQECRRILTGYFFQQGWLKVFERKLDVTLEGTKAIAKLEVLVARGEPVESVEDLLPKQASRIDFDLELEKKDGAWSFTQADYTPRPVVEP